MIEEVVLDKGMLEDLCPAGSFRESWAYDISYIVVP